MSISITGLFPKFYYGTVEKTESLMAGVSWNGTPGSGYPLSMTPTDPERTTAKPICRPLFRPRRTITEQTEIGVGAAANANGSLFDNCGLSKVVYHLEGGKVEVKRPSYKTRIRPDGSIWECLGWWVAIEKTATNGWGDLYIEAVPKDPTMQKRVIGPIQLRFAEQEHDMEISVGAGRDYVNANDAFNAVATAEPENPLIKFYGVGSEKLSSGSLYYTAPAWCTIEADSPLAFREDPPSVEGDFTRVRPKISNLCFRGPNVTVDFVETLQFDPYVTGAFPAFVDGAKIRQSRGREDLWRKSPRNFVPALFRGEISTGAVYLIGADIKDVSDVGDKAGLVFGSITDSTWADLFQGALCIVGNKTINHSSAFYYTNIDSMSISYSGAGTPTVSIRNGPRRLVLRVDGADVAEIELKSSEQAFVDDDNYHVQDAVDFVNARPDWSAILLDNSRQAASLSPPDTKSGKPEEDIPVPANLPCHFDIHSDWFQVPNSSYMENVYISQNIGYQSDMQCFLIPENTPGNTKDFAIFLNAFHNRTGTSDENLKSGSGQGSHISFVANTLATQRLSMPSADENPDTYCLVANNIAVRFAAANGDPGHPDVPVKNNHMMDAQIALEYGLTSTAVGTTFGGDHTTLFVDAENGDFTPTAELLAEANLTVPIVQYDAKGQSMPASAPKGALAQ